MTELQWFDVFRVISACMLSFVIYNQGVRLHRLREKFTPPLRDLWWVFTSSMMVLLFLSVEPLFTGSSGGPESILIFGVACIAFRTALRKPFETFEPDDLDRPRNY